MRFDFCSKPRFSASLNLNYLCIRHLHLVVRHVRMVCRKLAKAFYPNNRSSAMTLRSEMSVIPVAMRDKADFKETL